LVSLATDGAKHRCKALSFHREKHASKAPGENELVNLYLSNKHSHKMMKSSDEEIYALTSKPKLYEGLPEKAEPFHLIRRDEVIPVH
jgi:hypothetical protein